MNELRSRHDAEMIRMYDKLKTLEPGSEEYEKVLSMLMKAKAGESELAKIEADKETANRDLWVKIGMFTAGLVMTPVIDTLCKGRLVKLIGTVEQMETFTSTPGRSMSSWFKWKN